MPIPTFEKILRPLLVLASMREITRRDATPAMADHFQLSDEERLTTITTGATVIHNRTGWAMTFLTKGGLIEKISPRTYRATEKGKEFLLAHPTEITVRDLKKIEGWEEAWKGANRRSDRDEDSPLDTTTPLESVDLAIDALHQDLKSRLMSSILEQSPTFFEQLVLDVLLAMGYGGSRADAAERLGKSGDEGIDGRINQDPLGLDQILVQAKRYAPDRPIDRKTIQAFIGSMTGQGVTKGIFITTSTFNGSASEFVQRGANVKVILIDGEQLLTLMLRHGIGVRTQRTIQILEIDQNYFDEEE